MVTGQLSTRPSSSSGSLRPTLASQCARRIRSATSSAYRSASSPPVPKELPATDPHGHGSYLRGLARHPGPAPQRLATVPETVMPIAEKKRKKKSKGIANSLPSMDLLDGVPMELARAVVNMQEYYASGVDELTGKLGSVEEELRRAKDENRQMERRLDMHFVMLRQAAEFMQRVNEVRGVVMPVVDEVEITGDGDDLKTTDVNMEVPPTPVGESGMLMTSTGRKASNRRECPTPRSKGKEKKRIAMKEMLPLRGRITDFGSGDENGIGPNEKSDVEIPPEEESHVQSDDGHGHEDDDDNDGIRILKGAPRLRSLLRRSIWTAINDPPSGQHTSSPNSDPVVSDYDDYRPSSPSASSTTSSAASPSFSLYEENTSPACTPNPKTPSPKTSSPKTPSPKPQPQTPRYSTPRHTTTPRYASGPPSRPFRFHRMGRTVLDVWTEYKLGTRGNPAIEALELEYGTGWRAGSLRQVKYASNYVGVRQKVVNKVEELCEREGISAEEACRRLDERVDGRMQMLISAVRRGQDPFEVIPKR
ncbi:hypothetical protein ACHAQJ_006721 [Trichoderma viride]